MHFWLQKFITSSIPLRLVPSTSVAVEIPHILSPYGQDRSFPQLCFGLPLILSPDIQRVERQLAAATARIGVAKADLFPHFSLTGNAGLQSVSASAWFEPASSFWTVGPTVTWRVFDAGRIRSNIRAQDARERQALADYEQTVLSAFEDVENSLSAFAKEQTRYHSLRESVDAQQAAVNLSRDLYQNGLSDFIRVLDSERSLYQAQDALVQSQASISENLVALYKALGGGWHADSETNSPLPSSNKNRTGMPPLAGVTVSEDE
jgi:outer membrane protein TolC